MDYRSFVVEYKTDIEYERESCKEGDGVSLYDDCSFFLIVYLP
jgi:hypothetical protein